MGAVFQWAAPWLMDELRPDELKDMERLLVELAEDEEV